MSSATNGTVKLSLEMSEDAAAKLTEIAARANTSVGEVWPWPVFLDDLTIT